MATASNTTPQAAISQSSANAAHLSKRFNRVNAVAASEDFWRCKAPGKLAVEQNGHLTGASGQLEPLEQFLRRIAVRVGVPYGK